MHFIGCKDMAFFLELTNFLWDILKKIRKKRFIIEIFLYFCKIIILS